MAKLFFNEPFKLKFGLKGLHKYVCFCADGKLEWLPEHDKV
jgi:hypothetical protein